MKTIAVIASLALASLLGCTDNRTADTTGQSSPPAETSTGSTAQNTPSAGSSTTGSTAMSETDRALVQRVEDALRQDSAVGSAAQNVEVLASNGEVTLRGSVNNEQEKANIASTAQKVTGVSKVNNEIEVASASSR